LDKAPGTPDAVRHRSTVMALPEGPGPAIHVHLGTAAAQPRGLTQMPRNDHKGTPEGHGGRRAL
jgi:hypothetical protein